MPGEKAWPLIYSCPKSGKSWLRRILDEKALAQLDRLHDKYGISVAGEGGEYESFVAYGPHMRRRVRVEFEKAWKRDSGSILIQKAWLE